MSTAFSSPHADLGQGFKTASKDRKALVQSQLLTLHTHVQGVRLNHANFASEEVICFRLGVKDGQKCPFKDSNGAALMLTTPCRISGDHPSLTLFVHIHPPMGILTLAHRLGYSPLRRKIPHVRLVPLNVGLFPDRVFFLVYMDLHAAAYAMVLPWLTVLELL